MMKPFELYIAYIGWFDGGKNRPVLIFSSDDKAAYVYRITTQYASKSEAVKAQYFCVIDWQKAGLDKPSYIDTSVIFAFLPSDFANKKPIGTLTEDDKQRFIKFMEKRGNK